MAYEEIFETDVYKSNRKSFHVSFLVKKRILSSGINYSDKTHPIAGRFNYWGARIHSELAAILDVEMPQRMRVVPGSTMCNFRFLRDRKMAISKPCPKCIGMMAAFGIKNVIYWDGNFKEIEL